MQNILQVTFHNIYELAKSQLAWKGIKKTKECFKTNRWEYYVSTLCGGILVQLYFRAIQ
jgi:hypothetical protein